MRSDDYNSSGGSPSLIINEDDVQRKRYKMKNITLDINTTDNDNEYDNTSNN